MSKPNPLHRLQEHLVARILNRKHPYRSRSGNVLLFVVDKQNLPRRHIQPLSRMPVDLWVRLRNPKLMRKRMVCELIQPGKPRADSCLHRIAYVRENPSLYPSSLQALRPRNHWVIWLRPERVVRLDEHLYSHRIEWLVAVASNVFPIGQTTQSPTIVRIAMLPIGGLKRLLIDAKNPFHIDACRRVRGSAQHHSVVEENSTNLRFVGHGSTILCGQDQSRSTYHERVRKYPMNFSQRTDWNLAENELAAAVRAHRAAGNPLLDLTISNPTGCGFRYEDTTLLSPLSNAAALHYEPDPLGMITAREAVARYYSDAGANIPVDHICLTTSTSEAYSFLFRLLCNAGDEVLVARPSYPLFDYIAQLDDVRLREYPLLYDPNADIASGQGWSIDLHALEAAITPKTRAVILVHPNNPTGNFTSPSEHSALETICLNHGLALIVDEVFLDYPLGISQPTFATGQPQCLTFVLSGISKVCGLPQMKASWIVVCGPSQLVRKAMQRIEIIADTFLSMNAPIQFALPTWLAARHAFQQQIRERMTSNLAVLDARLRSTSAQRLAMQGGWTAVLRVPRTVEGREFAEAALRREVLVQPGDLYGLTEGRAVISLLTPPEIWIAGLNLLPID
jgi:alanine-synthesizing transaminase